jgi:deazaflavin-dependent oxidoreductase (nitroreductase family)
MAVELTPKGTRGAQIPRMPRPLMNAMMGLSVAFYRLLGGRVRVQGAKLLLLTTVGARSGKTRRTVLGWFPDGDDSRLVVASNTGAASHPAWYFNMARNPDKVWIEVGKRKLKVRPESLKGAEREAAWRRIAAQSPGYAAYQEKTDREIPVIRLRPAPASPTDE